MRRNLIGALVVILVTLPLACEPGPTPTPTIVFTPTATAGPTEATSTPTMPPTPSPTPTPTPVAGPIDLGVPAGDAYGPVAMAVDAARGLVYVVSGYGDAVESEGDSVLSVVDMARGEVRRTVALPHSFRGSTTMALAPAGDRLFIAGGDDHLLLTVATGVGDEPPGNELASQPDVRAIALDPTSLRLYAVGADEIRVLDVDTGEELQRADAPAGLPVPPAQIFVAVNSQTSRLYLGSPNNDIVTVLRIDDLQKVADILPAGQPEYIVGDPGSSQAYLVMRVWPDGVEQVAVIEGQRVVRVWQPRDGFNIRGVVPDDAPDRAYVWEAGSDAAPRLRAVDPISGQTMATVSLPTQSITKAVIMAGRLYLLTWNNVLIAVAVDDGTVESVVSLGVTLRDAVIDQETSRLFVIDSTGTVHVLDAASLLQLDTWPYVVGTGTESVYSVPLAVTRGRLFVPDYDVHETVVLDAATGKRIATIPKAGQVTLDAIHNRLFVTGQGVFIVDPETHTVVDSIDETIRKTQFSGEPSAMRAEYDAKHDLLFVTMTNNTPGSSASTWLQIYDGETLQRLDTAIRTDQQFLSGLAIDAAADRVYVASGFPGSDLAVFTVRGQLLTRLQHLGGQLFLDEAQHSLYVTGWDGLVTLDTTPSDPSTDSEPSVIDYRRLPSSGYREFTVFDAGHARLYTTLSNTADLLILSPGEPQSVTSQSVGQLPARQIRYLTVTADDTVVAVIDQGAVYKQRGDGWELISGLLPPLDWPAIHPAPGAPTVLFAHLKQSGHAFGLFRSLDGGQTWRPADRGLKDFEVRDLALSPDFAADRTAFLLAGDDGIFRTTDGGDTWQKVSDVTGRLIALASTATDPAAFLVLAPNPDTYDETRVYAPAGGSGTVEQIGTIGAGMLSGTDALALSPNFARDGTAIAGLYRSGLFLSQDFGHTWRQLPPRPEAFSPVYTLRFSPNFASDRTVYALIAPSYFGQDDRSVLFRSTDGEQTWQRAKGADPLLSALAMGPAGELWTGDTRGNVTPLEPAKLTWEIAREPTPTPVPTPAEPPAGFYKPEGAFADLWAGDPELRRALGWAAEQSPRQVSTAFQPFEGGVMIWRGDTRMIYVLYNDGSWGGFEDTWTPDEPERDQNIQPPPGREQPVRGFGKVWREQPGVRDRLGWALQAEAGYTSPVQAFERGTALGVGPSVYVLTRVAGEPGTWLSR